MLDAIIVSGFSDYNPKNSYAVESPFLLYRKNQFCDVPGLYKSLINPEFRYNPSDYEAPPLVCYILKQLLHNKGYSSEMVFYLDLEHKRMNEIFKQSCRAVFLSTTLIYNKQQLVKAVEIIRSYKPDAVIICGGAFVDRSWLVRNKYYLENDPLYASCKADHLFFDDSLDLPEIDFYIINDHELSIASQVLENIKKGKKAKDIALSLQNCAIYNKNRWEFSKTVDIATSLIPSIDWAIFRDDEVRLTVPMLRSKGCPNRCRFCNFQKISKYQIKDIGDLKKELLSLLENHSNKVKNIYFCDDNFCGNKNSIHDFLQLSMEIKLPLQWISLFDARFLDSGFTEQLKKSGCVLLKIGMESACDTILENMAKPCRVKHYAQAVSSLKNAEISMDAYFIVGYPGETEDTVKETIDALNSFAVPDNSVNQMIFFPFLLAPLAQVFSEDYRKKYELSGYMQQWTHKTMDFDTANNIIPNIVRQIKTMQPLHGNIEKMIVLNKKLLSEIDRTRGDIIRKKLSANENDSDWEILHSLVAQLKTTPFKNSDAQLFV